ncbi:hypothetical protein WKH27_19615 [Pantoea agglomerans]|uniref:DUF5862 domain-containing protein n=1 Tax=Enterobacter agglomerans TaxID=549 RepID=A0ABD6XM04_ENTAG|nr:hypothetical protein [Pantoea agglomerans]WNK35443.1 hypothetical protein RM158_00900 [Pantoea agglomerans]WNK53659.1 hypothetical protein RM154_00900 [Pantoea agglomerans]WNK71651.1 hypothetical protein RM155_01000 [Pantoea agglomerans]
MRELSTVEQQFVSGAAITMETWATMDQVLSNVLDGMSTGMALGGKLGGGGGFIFGALSQLVGIVVGPIMGGTLGLVSSLTIGYEETGLLLNDYRKAFGAE